MLDGVSAWAAIAVALVTVGAAAVAVRRWWLRRGAVLDVQVERTAGGHRLCVKNNGRGSAFGVSVDVKVMVHGKPFDPVGATAGQGAFPVRELPGGADLPVPMILLESGDPQLEAVVRWTESTNRSPKQKTFWVSYTW